MADYYPIMLDVRGRPALVIGSGRLAREKAAALAKAGALVQAYAGKPDISVVHEAFLVLAATDKKELIDWLKMIVRPHQLFHVVDRPEDSGFVCPSVLQRGAMTVSVSTDGTCPALARLVRERLEGMLGPEWEDLLELAASARRQLRRAGVSMGQRSAFFDELVASDVLAHLQAGRRAVAEAMVNTLLHRYQAGALSLVAG